MKKVKFEVFETIKKRRSVRTYSNGPIDKDIERALYEFFNSLFKIHNDIEIDWKVSNEGLKSRAVFGEVRKPLTENHRSLVEYGFEGEQIVLYLTSRNLGTCWLARSIKPNVPAIISFGVPAKPLFDRSSSINRKPLKSFLKTPVDRIPQRFLKIFEMCRLAPSGLNHQPWIFEYDDGDMIISTTGGHYIDLGIVLAHAYLATIQEFKKDLKVEGIDPNKYRLRIS